MPWRTSRNLRALFRRWLPTDLWQRQASVINDVITPVIPVEYAEIRRIVPAVTVPADDGLAIAGHPDEIWLLNRLRFVVSTGPLAGTRRPYITFRFADGAPEERWASSLTQNENITGRWNLVFTSRSDFSLAGFLGGTDYFLALPFFVLPGLSAINISLQNAAAADMISEAAATIAVLPRTL